MQVLQERQRKGPGLKACVLGVLFQGPKGPCSLRKHKCFLRE